MEPTPAMAAEGALRIAVHGEGAATWRVITLNRPDKLNAFTGAMLRALKAELDAAVADPSCRALVITGAGRGFSAGQDLADPEVEVRPGETPDLSATLIANYNPLILAMRAAPIPIVAAVNGVAAGAGLSLALASDIVLAGASARFGQAFVKIGLIPDSGGTALLPRLIGPARARAWAMTGETIPAETAERWGLVHRVVADEAVMKEANALAAGLAAASPAALSAIKSAMDCGAEAPLAEHLAYEAAEQKRLGSGPDYAEGVAAFMGRRKPVFGSRS